MQPGLKHIGFLSRSSDQTQAFGAGLGKAARPGDLILLRGPFGAGKTTMVQGIAAGLEVTSQVTSPSFTLINEYHGRLHLCHVDLFRLKELDLEMEQAVEYCEEGEGLTVIEWPHLLPADLQEGALRIDLEVVGDDDRSLVIHTEGSRWSSLELEQMIEAALRVQREGGLSAGKAE